MIDSECVRKFVLKQVTYLGDSVKNSSVALFGSHWWVLFAHYLYSLGEFEQPMLALSQLNRALYQNSSTSNNKNSSSNNNSNISHNGMSGFHRRLLVTVSKQVKLRMMRSKKDGIDKTLLFTLIVDSFLISELKSKELKENILKLIDLKIKLSD